MKSLERAFWLMVAAYFVIAAFGAAVGPTDATDPQRKGYWFPDRSGLQPYTDHGTGCQYLRAGSMFGGSALTPRLDATGKPMCGAIDSGNAQRK